MNPTSEFNNFLDGPPPKKLIPRKLEISPYPAMESAIKVKKALKIEKNRDILRCARQILENPTWTYKSAQEWECEYLVNRIDYAKAYENLKKKKVKRALKDVEEKQFKVLSKLSDSFFKYIGDVEHPKDIQKKTRERYERRGGSVPESAFYYTKGKAAHRNVSACIKLYVLYLQYIKKYHEQRRKDEDIDDNGLDEKNEIRPEDDNGLDEKYEICPEDDDGLDDGCCGLMCTIF